MLNEPTIDQLRDLGLTGMIEALLELRDNSVTADLGHEEWLGLLLDREATKRANKSMTSRLRAAKLRQQAVFEDVNYRIPRGLDRDLFLRLGSNQWVRDKNTLLITGPCGVGKSFLACALGHKACRDNLSVSYRRCHRLFAALSMARLDGSYARQFKSLTSVRLLILDDFGPEPLTADQRRDLLEIIEERHGAAATLITSQLPVDHWHDVIGCPTLADAILDRLVHTAHRIQLKGESLRQGAPQPSKAPAETA
jgi:DNA replication protein DnaC